MITSGFVYWILMLDSINNLLSGLGGFFGFFALGCGVAFLISWFCRYDNSQDIIKYGPRYKKNPTYWEEEYIGARSRKFRLKCMFRNIKSLFVWFLLLAIFFLTASALLPSTNQMAAIYLIPKLANSQGAAELAKIPETAAKLLNDKMEQWINQQMGDNNERQRHS